MSISLVLALVPSYLSLILKQLLMSNLLLLKEEAELSISY
jgi:hypothetical protein